MLFRSEANLGQASQIFKAQLAVMQCTCPEIHYGQNNIIHKEEGQKGVTCRQKGISDIKGLRYHPYHCWGEITNPPPADIGGGGGAGGGGAGRQGLRQTQSCSCLE